jgi:propionyl-CoA synthetase
MTDYNTTHRASIETPEEFWGKAAEGIDWYRRWDKVLDNPAPDIYRWFSGGQLNTCYNALDRHVERGRGEQTALIYDSPVTDSQRKISYAELLDEVSRFAGAIAAQGVEKGDRVIVYMPMIPEAIIAVLACARLGAVHSVVFGGFAANELATRIDDATPKLIVSASCGIEPTRIVEYKPLLDEAIDLSTHKPDHCILYQRPQAAASMIEGRDVDWNDAVAAAEPHDCVPVEATDPLYLLYTSGTTGQPKGIVRDNGGHAVALHWSMKNIYGVDPGEVYWAASDIGWVVGHSYIIYGPLLHGNTTILFEGKPIGTPDAGAFWRVASEHNVATMFTAPTAFRAIKQQDPNGELIGNYDLSNMRALFLAGERCDPDTLHWAEDKLGIPVIDHWWQTETGWAIAANCIGIELLPVKAGSVGRGAPGWDVRALDSDGNDVKPGDVGAIACKLPLPPGTLPGLWQAEERFRSSYLTTFPGFYETGDAGFIDEDGYIYVMSRTDDVINVAGHRLSTGAIEEVLASHPDVAECAVIGAADQLKGQLPLGFLVLKAGVDRDPAEIVAETVALVREKVGPVAVFKKAVVVGRLPKTRSGKILRATMRSIADGGEYRVPATIEDPVVLDEIGTALQTIGYAS